MADSAIYTASSRDTGCALCQGELVSSLVQVQLKMPADGKLPVENRVIVETIHPIAIVLSQDCELDWDFKARKQMEVGGGHASADKNKEMPNVLFAMIETAEDLRGDVNSGIWNRIRQNKDERYHFLERIPAETDAAQAGLPELGIDFKRYFTIPTGEVYARLASGEAKRRCTLVSPYRQHLIARFFYFQSRVALPREHESEPIQP